MLAVNTVILDVNRSACGPTHARANTTQTLPHYFGIHTLQLRRVSSYRDNCTIVSTQQRLCCMYVMLHMTGIEKVN